MFDSSALTLVNCFGQRFPAVGTFPYGLAQTDAASALASAYPFTIKVMPSQGGEAQQHDVVVKKGDGELAAEPPELTIAAGDLVLWNSPDPSIPGFAVQVSLPPVPALRILFLAIDPSRAVEIESTGSARMHNNAFFTHPFGLPGDYRWMDANGGKAAGVIHVRTLTTKSDADRQAWLDRLAEGVGIAIRGDSVDKPEVDIIAGQTVVWSINSSYGIHIVLTPPTASGPAMPIS
jgi:plastocyanin